MPVNQDNSGVGDNVGRDKVSNYYGGQYHTHIEKSSLDIGEINKVVRDVMLTCITENFEVARNKILPYQSFCRPLEETGKLFNILVAYIDSLENDSPVPIDTIRSELVDQSSAHREIYQSLLVKTLAKKNTDSAWKVYDKFKDEAKYYLLAVYDQYFSTKDELLTRLENEIHILDDYLLFYLAQGFIRLNDHQNAHKVLNQITDVNQTVNIQYFSIATELNSIIFSQEEPFSYIHRDVSQKIVSISDRFLSLISQEQNLEPLVVNILVVLAKMSMATINLPEIRDASLKFQSDISKFDKQMGDALEKIKIREPFLMPESLAQKLQSNEGLDEDEADTLVRGLLCKSIDLSLLRSWLDNCNEIIIYDDFDPKIMKGILFSFVSFQNEIEENEYRKFINDLLEGNINFRKELSPFIVKVWCDNLFRLGLKFEVVIYKILSSVCKDLDVTSDLNLYYLQSLLRLDKLDTLSVELSKIKDSEWNYDLYLFQARYFLKSGKYKEAQTAYNRFIDQEKDLYIWHEYLTSCMEGGKDTTLAKRELSRIPDDLLSIDSHGYEFFLFQVGFFIDFDFIERSLVQLFIKDPYRGAPIIANFYLNSFSSQVDHDFDNDRHFEGVHGGVTYKIDDQLYLKLLVDSETVTHQDLISVHSDLGKKIKSLDVGCEVKSHFGKVKLLKYETVIATIYNLSIEIVSASQHNYPKPLFRRLQIEEESAAEDILTYLKEVEEDNPIGESIEEFLRGSDLPLYVKGRKISESGTVNKEVDIALNLLLNEHANQCLKKTYDDVIDFDAIVVDVYSAVYLCMTNLYKSILLSETPIYISNETNRAIRVWIKNVTDTNVLRCNEYQGQLNTVNSENFYNTHYEFIQALQKLLDYSTIGQLKEFDLPNIASEIRGLELVSDSVFSTIKLALSHEIPWLCLDSVIGRFVKSESECKLINLHYFVGRFINNQYLTFNDRKKSLEYMTLFGLHYQYYLTDLIELSKNIDDLKILTHLLNNTTISLPDSEIALTLLISLLRNILPIGFNKKIVSNKIRDKEYLKASIKINMYGMQGSEMQRLVLEQVVCACIHKAAQTMEGSIVEERIANFILRFSSVYNNDKHLRFFYGVLHNYAVGHFLKMEDILQSLQKLMNDYDIARSI